MDENDWAKLIGGGFANMTAPFAVHQLDRERAKDYLREAKSANLSVSDAVRHAQIYLKTAGGFPTNESEQIERVRKFFSGKLID